MSIKVGRGRGKKGDGLHVARDTRKRTYMGNRLISRMSNDKLVTMLADSNTRAKDKLKLDAEICKRRILCA